MAEAVGCSEYLIWLLAFGNKNITHPNIADRIADFLGATPEQRDSIVHKNYHGTWKPNKRRKYRCVTVAPTAWNAKPVVAIDRLGKIIKQYPSVENTANSIGSKNYFVSVRCNHVSTVRDEFKPYGMSFRFAEEWIPLTDEERLADIQAEKERIKCEKTFH